MAYAIAWEIVRRAHGTNEFYNNNAKDRVRILANEWIKAYQAIWSEQIIPDGE